MSLDPTERLRGRYHAVMDTRRTDLKDQIDEATDRLIATIGRMTEEEVRAPSLLPGWTRGHVITHVARNADGLRNLLTWARTGVVTPAYASQEARNAEIEEGAHRPVDILLADVAESAAAFNAEAASLSDDDWKAEVDVLGGPKFAADLIIPRRLAEVELHHTDLGTGYKASDWLRDFTELELSDPMRTWRTERASW